MRFRHSLLSSKSLTLLASLCGEWFAEVSPGNRSRRGIYSLVVTLFQAREKRRRRKEKRNIKKTQQRKKKKKKKEREALGPAGE